MLVKLKDVAYLVNDRRERRSDDVNHFVSTENLLSDRRGVRFPASTSPKSKYVHAFTKGDILISNIRPYFKKIWKATFDGTRSADVLCFRSSAKELSQDYLYVLLESESFFNYVTKTAKGTKMPRGDKSAILEFEFNLPSLKIQKEISHQIISIEKKIRLNEQINDNLLELTSNAVKEFVDSHNNMRRTNIYHYCDIQYGAPYKSKLFNDKAVGLPLIRIRDLRSGEPLYYTEEITGRDIIVNTGDLLIGMDAEFRPTLWKGSKSKLNQRVLKVVPKKEITNIFLLNILNPYMVFLENSKTGTTVIHLGKKDLDSISLPLFLENDLIEFNKKLLPQNLYISNLFEETRKLDKLKNILVREYF